MHKNRMGASPVRACDSAAVNHVRTRRSYLCKTRKNTTELNGTHRNCNLLLKKYTASEEEVIYVKLPKTQRNSTELNGTVTCF